MIQFKTHGQSRKHWMLYHYCFRFLCHFGEWPSQGKIANMRKIVENTHCPDDDKPLEAETTCNHGIEKVASSNLDDCTCGEQWHQQFDHCMTADDDTYNDEDDHGIDDH